VEGFLLLQHGGEDAWPERPGIAFGLKIRIGVRLVLVEKTEVRILSQRKFALAKLFLVAWVLGV